MTTRIGTDKDTVTQAGNLIENTVTGLMAPFSGNVVEQGIVQGTAIAYGLIGLIGGGMLARKRAVEGKPAIAGFIL